MDNAQYTANKCNITVSCKNFMVIGEQDSLGILNANLLYMEVRMSPLLVARAPYDKQGDRVRPQPFLGWQACGMWAELNISGWIWAQLKKRSMLRFTVQLSIFTTMALTTAAKVSQLCTRKRSAVSFCSD